MKITKQQLINYANAIVFGITIIGFNIVNVYKAPVELQLIASLILGAIYFYLAYKNTEKTRSFNESSEKFYEYFYTWYNQDGKLYIYCTDLNWLDANKNALGQKAIFAIRNKGKDAYIFLKDTTGPIVTNLKQFGVNVFTVEKDFFTDNRFSMITHEGLKKIIIRNKKEDGDDDNIMFFESDSTKDPYLLSLAMDLLESSTQGFSFDN